MALKLKTYINALSVDNLNYAFSQKELNRTINVCIDSRNISPMDIFIAIVGKKHDSHTFIDKNIINKASFVIVNKSWYENTNIKCKKIIPVTDTVKAMLFLAHNILKNKKIKVVAITGTNGKTTTRRMVAKILSTKYRVSQTIGNFNNNIGVPLSVFNIKEKTEIAVLELGTNHFMEIDELSRCVRPFISVITNIGNGHIEYFKTKKGVLRAKTEIVNGMDKGVLVVNNDDELLSSYLPPKDIKKVTYGFFSQADFMGKHLNLGITRKTNFKFLSGKKMVLNIPGKGAAYNALCSSCVGSLLNISQKHSINAISKLKADKSRMEIRKINQILYVIDCYNANPESIYNALELIKEEENINRRIAVIGDMNELGEKSDNIHTKIGKSLKKYNIDFLYTLGAKSELIYKSALKSNLKKAYHFNDPFKLKKSLKQIIKKKDLLLFKASNSMNFIDIAKNIMEK